MACYRAVPDGVIVAVRLTPKAARESLDGVGRLADGSEVAMARVRALPAKGAANGALVTLLAKALKVSRQSVTIVGGAGARLKRVRIVGDPGSLSGKIEQWPSLS
jgi:uncharacterized protein YggU (UPF0235/DUF167 family)